MSAAVKTKPGNAASAAASGSAAPMVTAMDPGVTWGTEMHLAGKVGKDLAMECVYDLAAISYHVLSTVNNRRGSATPEEHHSCSITRMYFIRVAALSSILMAYIGEEGISLKDAHLEIYGDGPAEGEMP